ncbi:ribose-phosphate pyrophosphokinase [Massilia sp. W12]|uniref:ribose-phosphate pyrophosphokinase n=1 Tax=Massilia sp. W12 TaxID=3126507 RepID=UPI0030CC1164
MSETPLIFALPGNEAMAQQLSAASGWQVGAWQLQRFPDGESKLRYLSQVQGRDVVLVCTLDQPDMRLMPLYLAASVARELGARRIGLVAPYLAYMRQDARFHPGEGITSAHFARLLSSFADWLITVDPHLHRHHSLDEIYSIPSKVVAAAPSIAAWLRLHLPQAVLIGPDEESEQWVAAVAQLAACRHTVLRKVRHGDHEVEVSVPDSANWQGLQPVLLDDIASTARTMVAACNHLHAAGLPPPVCIAVHALFAGDAWQVLQQAGVAQVVSCDTVLHISNQISMAPALAQAMMEMQAVSSRA